MITHETILLALQRKHKNIEFDEEDILNWCQEIETIHIADPDAMVEYYEIPLTVVNDQTVLLPSNVYKLEDVYIESSDKPVPHRRNQRYLKLINFTGDTININYRGTPINGDCLPMIASHHQPACELFCLINSYEERAINGKVEKNLYFDWKMRFDNACAVAKNNWANVDNQGFEHKQAVWGNMIPRIGKVELAHKKYDV